MYLRGKDKIATIDKNLMFYFFKSKENNGETSKTNTEVQKIAYVVIQGPAEETPA